MMWVWGVKVSDYIKEIGMKGIYYAYENRFFIPLLPIHPFVTYCNRYMTSCKW